MAKISMCMAFALVLFSNLTYGAPQGRPACPSQTAGDYYFPKNTFSPDNADSDASDREWYSKNLMAMGEPSLSCGSSGVAYRFTWLRTFHHPISVRIASNGNAPFLAAIELDGAGGYAPGKELRRKQFALSPVELKQIQDEMAKADFWSIPTSDEQGGLDGARWILEVADKGRYHVVVRWSPETGAVHDIAMRFLRLAGWNPKGSEIY